MPCFSPQYAAKLSGGKLSLSPSPRERLGRGLEDWIELPCGSCVGCRKSRAREWAIRCSLELQFHSLACWATLTYDDEHLPPTLSKRHLQLFLKRLRERLPRRSLRFFASGEYGETSGRPHYHPILYGTEDEKLIQECWPHGFAQKHVLLPQGIAYVVGYSVKKLGVDVDSSEFVDVRTGELVVRQPPFVQMSRRPGIGGRAREWRESWRKSAVYLGREVAVPRFLHARWKEHAEWAQMVELGIERAREARKVSEEERRAGEAIAMAEVNLQAARRQL